jgi:ribonuclease HI/uncharacterized phage-like protein YoqJ
MEIAAALEAVRANGSPTEAVVVVSDSTYVVNCFRDRWWQGWLRKGWVNSQRKPVANRDLWEPLVELVRERDNVAFRWVKGHSGDPHNDLVDRLAVEAAQTQQPRSGASPPGSLGRADRQPASRQAAADTTVGAPGSGASSPTAGPVAGPADPWQAGADLLDGFAVAVLGHRLADLGGEEHHPLAEAVRERIGDVLAGLADDNDRLAVVSGLRLGAEALGAEAAVLAGLPLDVVLPFPEPHHDWPVADQRRFEHLLARARAVVVLDERRPRSTQAVTAALSRRDAWLARFCDGAVLVWDGTEGRLGRLHRSLVDHLADNVWLVDPAELADAHRH